MKHLSTKTLTLSYKTALFVPLEFISIIVKVFFFLKSLLSTMDVGEQMEVVVSMISGKKPGAFITLIGVATVHITFKVHTFFLLLNFDI